MCEVRDLKPNGANILVTEENKKEYVHLVCQMKMTGDHLTLHSRSSSRVMGVDDVQMGLLGTLCVTASVTVCSLGAIRKQLAAFLEGFYEIIPKRLISIFTEQELELLISGLPTIDIDDLKANTEYHKYQSSSIQVLPATALDSTRSDANRGV